MGEHDISSTTDGEIQDIKVRSTTKHDMYNKRDGTNDIAILHLDDDAKLSSESFYLAQIKQSSSNYII